MQGHDDHKGGTMRHYYAKALNKYVVGFVVRGGHCDLALRRYQTCAKWIW